VHSALGPGLLESTYQTCLQYEFVSTGLKFERQVKLPVVYREISARRGISDRFLCRKFRDR
jgi:GxxExxY protein